METQDLQDPKEAYDAKHGKPGADHVPVDLTEAANQSPPADEGFKITNQGR